MTEAAYFGFLRSALRRAFRYWKPLQQAKIDSRIPYHGENKRQKWMYKCAACKGYFKGSQVEVDHIHPIGTLKRLEDLPAFVERLTAESGYQVLCKSCHLAKTNSERAKKSR
jgi:5-methylcytosine-specific restriction endonuclease McrA